MMTIFTDAALALAVARRAQASARSAANLAAAQASLVPAFRIPADTTWTADDARPYG